MLGRVEQLLVFVLAVKLDQPVREVLQRRGRGQRGDDEGPAAALTRDLPADDQLRAVGSLEAGFDGREFLARAKQVLGGRQIIARPPG